MVTIYFFDYDFFLPKAWRNLGLASLEVSLTGLHFFRRLSLCFFMLAIDLKKIIFFQRVSLISFSWLLWDASAVNAGMARFDFELFKRFVITLTSCESVKLLLILWSLAFLLSLLLDVLFILFSKELFFRREALLLDSLVVFRISGWY